MGDDLNYFYERDLDKKNLQDFYWSLPSHLQQKVRPSIRTSIVHLNTLQGYRGPSEMCNGGSGDSGVLNPSHGLQEIKFWWAARKDLNYIPVLGTIIWAPARFTQSMAGNTEWSSLYFDSKTGECLSHDRNQAAAKLHSIGLNFFREGRFSEADEYCRNAYRACSSGYYYESTFLDDANRAEDELKARNLNSEGDRFFRQREYSQAYHKYKEAYGKSRASEYYQIYKANRDKAQAEVDAKNLNSQTDILFEQGNYSEAESKYQEAYDKSQVQQEKNVYSSNKDKVRDFSNRLVLLDNLWAEGWNAENDNENDRSEQASEIFERISDETMAALIDFPGNRKFEQYRALVTLKIEGNQVFNQGVEAQQHGISLFQDAQRLKQQAKYESANVKFREAKNCFENALRKFETGRNSDERFFSCVEFVREHINEVTRSIEMIDNNVSATDLQNLEINFNGNENLNTNPYSHEDTEKYKEYSAHID